LGGRGFPSIGGEAMEIVAAITIMILFGTFIIDLENLEDVVMNHKKIRRSHRQNTSGQFLSENGKSQPRA
jgi:ribonuclease PH